MTTEQVILGILGILGAIVSWFLIQTMNDLKDTKKESATNKNDIALLKLETSMNHKSLEDKLQVLTLSIVDLTHEIKELNKKS